MFFSSFFPFRSSRSARTTIACEIGRSGARRRSAPLEDRLFRPAVWACESQSQSGRDSAAPQPGAADAPAFGPIRVSSNTQARVSECCASRRASQDPRPNNRTPSPTGASVSSKPVRTVPRAETLLLLVAWVSPMRIKIPAFAARLSVLQGIGPSKVQVPADTFGIRSCSSPWSSPHRGPWHFVESPAPRQGAQVLSVIQTARTRGRMLLGRDPLRPTFDDILPQRR